MKKVPLILAPMAGFTDYPFRLLCREYGADETVTEMISALAMTYDDRKTKELSHIPKGDTPCSVQIFGHDPVSMAKAAKMLAEGSFSGCTYMEKPSAIDINMGCPVKKITSNGEGSALMKNPALAEKIVAAVVESSPIPVTIKIRAGWDAEHKNAVEIAKAAERAGAAAVTVHARTKDQMYAPGIDASIITAARQALDPKTKVYGNGDICSVETAEKMLRETECDGLMIGRAALGAPWLFAEIKAEMNGESYTAPTTAEKIAVARRFVADIVKLYGEETGVRMARGRAAHFIKGMRGSAEVRNQINLAATLKEFDFALSRIEDIK